MLEIILDWNTDTRGNVSRIHKTIQTNSLPSLEKTKLAWEQDLNAEFTGEVWEHSLYRIHTTSLCLRHCLIQFKVLHCLHYTREWLSKFYPNVDSTCIRCHLNSASAEHIFGECPSSIGVTSSKPFNIFAAIKLNPIQLLLFLEFPMRVQSLLRPNPTA